SVSTCDEVGERDRLAVQASLRNRLRILCGNFGGCLDSAPGVTATFSAPTGLAADAAGVL
ncbi:MAG: hypothetical protein ABI409_04065, partial [Ramlibacter sp.]